MPPFLTDVLPFWPYALAFVGGIVIEKIVPWIVAKLKAAGGGVAAKVTALEQNALDHAEKIGANAKSLFNVSDTLARTQAQIVGVSNDTSKVLATHRDNFSELFARVSALEAQLVSKNN